MRWLLCLISIWAASAAAAAGAHEGKSLVAFKSEQELLKYFDQLSKAIPLGPTLTSGDVQEIAVTGQRLESITNNQTEGVDEGGIVKVHGDHLVILRRGRLFTVAIGERQVRPISWINAFGPGIDPGSTWLDELLIYRDRIVVIGYSYRRDGTELGLFNIDARGRLTYEGTYHLRSNDYYSSRNYASRLLDGKLVFYTPLYFRGDVTSLPALRKWRQFAQDEPDDDDDGFVRIAAATQVYRPARALRDGDVPTLHTVTTCDLAAIELTCKAVVAIGPASEVFYVSATAAYVWTASWPLRGERSAPPGMLYRMPLDGSIPTALSVAGAPVDQFSFLESQNGHLNVLVRSESDGNWMWNAERVGGNAALLRVPLTRFGDGRQAISWSDYRALPLPESAEDYFHNRFVGEHLLYGTGDGWTLPEGKESQLFVVNIKTHQVTELATDHGIDRIEPLNGDAVIVGTDRDENLHFTGVQLASTPRFRQRHVIAKAAQGELRSHGFFYKPDSGSSGILALPIRGAGAAGASHLREDSASIVFLRDADGRFTEIGRLPARPTESLDDDADHCIASCIDWYGNARPIFLRGRTFALLGYEIVEGDVRDGVMSERSRMSFTPFMQSE